LRSKHLQRCLLAVEGLPFSSRGGFLALFPPKGAVEVGGEGGQRQRGVRSIIVSPP